MGTRGRVSSAYHRSVSRENVQSSMRALMLTPDEGHLDRRIAQEAASLASDGWMVEIYPAVDPALTFGGVLAPGVRLLASPHTPTPASTQKRALRTLRRRLGPILPPLDRLVEAARYRRSDRARALADSNAPHLLGLEVYDLVFAHDVPVFPLAARLAAAWDCPIVCDLHEIFPEQDEHFTTETARRYWRSVEEAGISAAGGIICVNAAVVDYVRDRYAPQATTVVIHNSMPYVEPDRLAGRTIRAVYPIPDGVRVMLFAGSLRPYANLEKVIGGFDQSRLEGWVLAVLGDGPLRGALEEMVRRRGLERRVFLGSRVPESELIEIAASADVGLLPYEAVGLNHTIATPNKLFEYMQARLPMATSQLPMIEKILGSSGIGGYVDYSSESTAATGLARFVAATLPGIEPDALEAAARRYSWEREEPALFKVVDAAMRRGRR